jgi:hypothetical protein
VTGAEFNAEVLTFLDVDARRRGIEDLRAAYTKAALGDLARYVEEYNVGQVVWADDEITPFDEKVAEAVAEFLKSRITRNVDRDLQLSQLHEAAYLNLRRHLALRAKEERTITLKPYIGKIFTVTLNLRALRLPLGIVGNVWFTVKRYRGEADCLAVMHLQRGEGIEVLDADASKIRVTLSETDTCLLSTLREYYWDVQVEDANHQPAFPVSGLIRPQQPVTHVFNPTLMSIGGAPMLTVAGVPISLVSDQNGCNTCNC